jgi:hypothetical protein
MTMRPTEDDDARDALAEQVTDRILDIARRMGRVLRGGPAEKVTQDVELPHGQLIREEDYASPVPPTTEPARRTSKWQKRPKIAKRKKRRPDV